MLNMVCFFRELKDTVSRAVQSNPEASEAVAKLFQYVTELQTENSTLEEEHKNTSMFKESIQTKLEATTKELYDKDYECSQFKTNFATAKRDLKTQAQTALAEQNRLNNQVESAQANVMYEQQRRKRLLQHLIKVVFHAAAQKTRMCAIMQQIFDTGLTTNVSLLERLQEGRQAGSQLNSQEYYNERVQDWHGKMSKGSLVPLVESLNAQVKSCSENVAETLTKSSELQANIDEFFKQILSQNKLAKEQSLILEESQKKQASLQEDADELMTARDTAKLALEKAEAENVKLKLKLEDTEVKCQLAIRRAIINQNKQAVALMGSRNQRQSQHAMGATGENNPSSRELGEDSVDDSSRSPRPHNKTVSSPRGLKLPNIAYKSSPHHRNHNNKSSNPNSPSQPNSSRRQTALSPHRPSKTFRIVGQPRSRELAEDQADLKNGSRRHPLGYPASPRTFKRNKHSKHTRSVANEGWATPPPRMAKLTPEEIEEKLLQDERERLAKAQQRDQSIVHAYTKFAVKVPPVSAGSPRPSGSGALTSPRKHSHNLVSKKKYADKRVFVFGPPGSGKGTQCALLSKFMEHISTGDLLRAEVKKGSEVGKKAQDIMSAGGLVPDALVAELVQNTLAECKGKGYMLDGFPRTTAQATILKDLNIIPTVIIKLSVPDAVLVDRVIGRRQDPDTGKIYHITSNPPPEDIKARLTTRPDDTKEIITTRIETYHKNINDILAMFSGSVEKGGGTQGVAVVEIDANQPPEKVYALIKKAIIPVATPQRGAVYLQRVKPGSY